MAEKRSESTTATRDEQQQRQRQNDTARQQRDTRLERTNRQAQLMNPFALLGRLAEQMTSVFTEASGPRTSRQAFGTSLWSPDIDVFQRGNELVVRADVPGVNPDNIAVEISDDAITLSGERSEEREEERNGVYRVERSYGSFHRVIPLPEGAITDQAKARFKDGVLEITMPAPPEQVSRGRRLEISKESTSK
jgi:HSP20 family protein